MFGDPTREAAIKATIDTVWAQAGINVEFLPNVVRYNNTFAYQGFGVGVRPISDLGLMMTNATRGWNTQSESLGHQHVFCQCGARLRR